MADARWQGCLRKKKVNSIFSSEGIELELTDLWIMKASGAKYYPKGGKGTNQYAIKPGGKSPLQGNKVVECQWKTLSDGRKICVGSDGKYYMPKGGTSDQKKTNSNESSKTKTKSNENYNTSEDTEKYVREHYRYEDSSYYKENKALLDEYIKRGDKDGIEFYKRLIERNRGKYEKEILEEWKNVSSFSTKIDYGEGKRLVVSNSRSSFGKYLRLEDTEGMIIEGKGSWIGKKLKDVPEAVGLVEKLWKERNSNLKTGDFKVWQKTEYNDLLARATYAYKAPLATDMSIVRNFADAYLNKNKLDSANILTKSSYEETLKNLKWYKEELKSPHGSPDTKSLLKNQIIQYQNELPIKMMDDISNTSRMSSLYSQEAVNQFASNVAYTQKTLAKEYPSGTITLYRGVQGDYAKIIKDGIKTDGTVTINTHPADSWTSSLDIATKFSGKSGVVITQEVPVTDILLSHKTTPYIRTSDFLFGGSEEYEYVVGNTNKELTLTGENII